MLPSDHANRQEYLKNIVPPKNNNKKHKTTTRTHTTTKNSTHTQNNKNNPPTATKKRRPLALETNHLHRPLVHMPTTCLKPHSPHQTPPISPKADYMTHRKHRAAGSWGRTPSSSCSAASPSPSGRRCFSPLADHKDKDSEFFSFSFL